MSTAISIKHRILATFNIKKKFNSDGLYIYLDTLNVIVIKKNISVISMILIKK